MGGRRKALVPETANAEGLIQMAALRQRAARAEVFDHQLPFSWLRWFRAALSYLLLFSDVPRSGLGIRDVHSNTVIEPSMFEFFGPWAYSVQQFVRNGTDQQPASVWSYKFDTTSVVWRAFAEYFHLATFPRCLFYEADCPGDTLNSSTTFAMMDSLATAVAAHHISSIILRTVQNYHDRLHNFVLPQLFVYPLWRTSQALYYPSAIVSDPFFVICQGPKARPFACSDLWTNYRRSCSPKDDSCQRDVGVVWEHIVGRIRSVEKRFPNHQVDLTVLESAEDTQVSRGSFCMMGSRDFDVSTIIRSRACVIENDANSTETCETVFAEDYRYEGGMFTQNVVDWYSIVSTLRICGQVYFVLRVVMLVVSCFVTRSAECHRTSAAGKMLAALRLFVRLPSQVVIYGSPLPIVLFALAHTIDASYMNEFVAQRFTTARGVLHNDLEVFFVTAAVQMRNVWLLAIALHSVVGLSTARWWAPFHGVLGAPPFTLSMLSSLTIFSQYRSLSFRNTKVLSISPMVGAERRLLIMRTHLTSTQYGGGHVLVQGVCLDFKMLFSLIVLVCTLRFVWWSCRRVSQSSRSEKIDLLGPARTPVPFSAGTLWPTVAVCIQWRGPMFQKGRQLENSVLVTQRVFDTQHRARQNQETVHSTAVMPIPSHPTHFPVRIAWVRRISKIAPLEGMPNEPALDHLRARLPHLALSWFSDWPVETSNLKTLAFVHHHLEHVHTRLDEVDAVVALMNLVIMSDPVVWLRLYAGAAIKVGYYQSTRSSNKVLLLPTSVVDQYFEDDEFVLLKCLSTSDMDWSDVIHCG